jgi:hypothetical protein
VLTRLVTHLKPQRLVRHKALRFQRGYARPSKNLTIVLSAPTTVAAYVLEEMMPQAISFARHAHTECVRVR